MNDLDFIGVTSAVAFQIGLRPKWASFNDYSISLDKNADNHPGYVAFFLKASLF